MYRTIGGLLLAIACPLTLWAQTEVVVTNANPQGWAIANQRNDSTVDITVNQPRSGTGSLEFVTTFVTPGQDKVDFELLWDPTLFPGRTLAALSNLSFEYHRDSGSAVGGAFHPVLRLRWANDGGTPADPNDDTFGQLIYEEIYQGVNPVPVDAWDTNTIALAGDNFWMFCNDCGGGSSGVVQNFSTTLSDWLAGPITGQPGDPVPPDLSQGTTFIFGINTGIGSGWGNDLLMWADNIRIGFGAADDLIYNFEGPTPDADLLLTKVANTPGPVVVGDQIIYTLTVTNNGPGDASNVQLLDTLPDTLVYVSDDCAMTVAGQDLTWDIGALLNGDSATCELIVDVIALGDADNTAVASATEPDPNTDDNTSTAAISGVLPQAVVVPVMNHLGLLLLLMGMLSVGVFTLRRKQWRQHRID
ncbi:MAG: hypothetical protein Tsb002_23750 [Wenzhouxiangellaceae bacterium]